MRHVTRAGLTAVLSLGLVLGLSSLMPATAAPARPTAAVTVSTTTSDTQKCRAATDLVAAAERAHAKAVTKHSRITKRIAKAKKHRAKAKKRAVRARAQFRAGKIRAKKRNAAVTRFRNAKKMVKVRVTNRRKQTRVVAQHKSAVAATRTVRTNACKATPAQKADVEQAAGLQVTAITDLLTDPVLDVLPAAVAEPLRALLDGILGQLDGIVAALPTADVLEVEDLLGQLTLLDAADLVGQLTSLGDLLGLAGDDAGTAQLRTLLESLMAASGGGDLPAGAGVTQLTDLLHQLTAPIVAADPTGLASALNGVVDLLEDVLGLLDGSGDTAGLADLLGGLAHLLPADLPVADLTGLLTAILGAIDTETMPGLGQLPALGGLTTGDQLALLTGLVALLGEALDPVSDLLDTVLGILPPEVVVPIDEIPVIGDLVCTLLPLRILGCRA